MKMPCVFLYCVAFASFTLASGLSSHLEASSEDTIMEIVGPAMVRMFERPPSHQRFLQDFEEPSCGDILASLDRDAVIAYISEQFGGAVDATLFAVLRSQIDYGVRVQKICAACSDFATQQGCTNDNSYGHSTKHSGVLILPLANDEDGTIQEILPGTHMSFVTCHGTQGSNMGFTAYPWDVLGSEAEITVSIFLAATGGHVGIVPDYMGYGESRMNKPDGNDNGGIYRGYLVRQAYQEAVLPLFYHARELARNDSDCRSAVGNQIATLGYSEGGFAAVSLADSMHGLGLSIVSAHAGAGPYRLSSAQISASFSRVINGTFPVSVRYYAALLGSAFSDTFADLPNFGANQMLLDPKTRDDLVNLVHSGADANMINAFTTPEDPISATNPIMRQAWEDARAEGSTTPCVTNAVDGVSDLLCQALQEQDLTQVLENTTYPVALCHSPDDIVVPIQNLPDLDRNELLSFTPASGPHTSAGATCFTSAVQYFLFQLDADVPDVTTASCSSSEPRPETVASEPPGNTQAPDFVLPNDIAEPPSASRSSKLMTWSMLPAVMLFAPYLS